MKKTILTDAHNLRVALHNLVSGMDYRNTSDEELAHSLINLAFTEQEEPKFEPKDRSSYYYVTGIGTIEITKWLDSEQDKERLTIGNCFPTREEAEAFRTAYLAFVKSYREKV